MKNQRMVKAYDSINPSTADRERILKAILQEANLEEAPQKTRRTREPVIYTSKPAKTSCKSLISGIAACIAVFLMSALVLSHMGRTPFDESAAVQPTAASTEQNFFEKTEQDHYESVLKKYRQALDEGWSKEQCEIEGISIRFANTEFARANSSYQILDLNNDGREELLICSMAAVWDLYTLLEDGTPVCLYTDELDGSVCFVYEDGVIGIELTTKTDAEYGYYRLENNHLVEEEMIRYVDSNQEWSRETGEQEWEVISRETACDIMYSYEPMALITIGFVEESNDHQEGGEAVEPYMLVLEKYKTALMEHWDRDKCLENDISVLAASAPGIHNNLGWCLMDIDGNSTQELIISYGSVLVDLYCMKPEDLRDNQMVKRHGTMENTLSVENGICHLARSEVGIQYTLSTDGTIHCQSILVDGTKWCNYQLKPWGMELQDVMVYRSQNEGTKAYAYGPHEYDLTYISQEEAGNIIIAHQPMELPVIPIVDEWPTYDLLLDTYKKALLEKWDIEQCMNNGICYMIAWLTENPEDLRACLMDLDEDGSEELLIVNGTTIYDLYTMKDGEPVQLFSGGERNHYCLWPDNSIINRGSGSAFWSVFNRYDLQDGELVLMESVISDYQKDPDNPWFRSPDGETLGEPLTRQEADAILEAYVPITFHVTPVLEWN